MDTGLPRFSCLVYAVLAVILTAVLGPAYGPSLAAWLPYVLAAPLGAGWLAYVLLRALPVRVGLGLALLLLGFTLGAMITFGLYLWLGAWLAATYYLGLSLILSAIVAYLHHPDGLFTAA